MSTILWKLDLADIFALDQQSKMSGRYFDTTRRESCVESGYQSAALYPILRNDPQKRLMLEAIKVAWPTSSASISITAYSVGKDRVKSHLLY